MVDFSKYKNIIIINSSPYEHEELFRELDYQNIKYCKKYTNKFSVRLYYEADLIIHLDDLYYYTVEKNRYGIEYKNYFYYNDLKMINRMKRIESIKQLEF
jgi:hypothetical protein